MKRIAATFAASMILCLIYGQNMVSIHWKFRTGDDMNWAMPDYDDSDWESIEAGKVWELQGYPDYDGFAWYRKSIQIASSLKKASENAGGFILDLGAIDDADEIYWNGKLLRATGTFPPSYEGAYDKPRKLEIPVNMVKWDSENLIAVRVYDHQGNGGIYGNQVSFRVKGMEDLFQINVKPSEKDHVFKGPGPVKIPVHIQNKFPNTLEGTMEVEVKNDFGKLLQTCQVTMKVRQGKTFVHIVELKEPEPGFYEVRCSFSGKTENKTYRFRFAYEPEKIISETDRPADFEEYWKRAGKELDAVEPQYRMIPQPELSTPERDVYLVEMRSLSNVLIRAWYARPVKAGVYPAILHVQGYSTNQLMDWGYPGSDMAVLVLNVRGHGNSRDHIDPGFPGYLQYFLDDPEMYIYRGAYMDCTRAIDFLFSRDEVDKSRVVVEGGSQGGALSFATAALNPDRVALCVPHVPFLSDFRDYFRLASWPGNEFIQYVQAHPEIGWDKVYHTLSYIDIKNLAPWVKAPVFMGVGLMDDVCPPHTNFAAYNQLNVPKEYLVYPWSGHGIDAEYHRLKYAWIRKNLGM